MIIELRRYSEIEELHIENGNHRVTGTSKLSE